ncbi:ATP-dependent DNA ligase [Alkalihalobacillus deserti]|uniref:ATP-dependent DNA ligase n=1 Tax=Alkalihalobacillus deserti TaxID=2879466 RepID=UPI001D137EF1|nr:RNA ligase family protein [Alkalihalobacillus deserti]
MFISPMLVKEVISPPEDYANVITELKLDGIRLIYSNLNGEIRLYTKNKQDVTRLFPEILDIQLPKGVVLDGELIATDRESKPDYQLLMNRVKSEKLLTDVAIQYVAFDILYYKGKRVTQLPLLKRKSLLDQTIPTDNITIVTSQWVEGNSQMYFDIVKDYGLEGIIVKKPMSKYQSGLRSSDWIKVINYKYIKEKITSNKGFDYWLLNQEKSQAFFLVNVQAVKNRKILYEKYRQFLKSKKCNSSI